MLVKVNDGILNVSFTFDNFDSAFTNSFILSYIEFHRVGYGVVGKRPTVLRYFLFAFDSSRLVMFHKTEHFDIAD